MSKQDDVYNAVWLRGYMDGWTDEQFLARQVVKLVEEVAESMAHLLTMPGYFGAEVRNAGASARWLFDRNEAWEDVALRDVDGLANELADLQVVLFCAAKALGKMTGTRFDVVEAAVVKAQADVGRGVRGMDGTRSSADERGA